MKEVVDEKNMEGENDEIEIGSIEFIIGFFKFIYNRIIKPG